MGRRWVELIGLYGMLSAPGSLQTGQDATFRARQTINNQLMTTHHC